MSVPQWALDNGAQGFTTAALTNATLSIPLGSSSAFADLALGGRQSELLIQDVGLGGGGPTAYEIVLANGNNLGTNTLAVTPSTGRGYDGTTPRSFVAGARVTQILGKSFFNTALVRTDFTASQEMSGSLAIPSAIGGSVAGNLGYGTLPVKIDDQLVGVGGASTIRLPASGNLPTWARLLVIEGHGASDGGGGPVTRDDVYIQFNADVAAHYGYTEWTAYPAFPGGKSFVFDGVTKPFAANIISGAGIANLGSSFTIKVPEPNGTSLLHTWRGESDLLINVTDYDFLRRAGYWNQSTALQSILLGLSTGGAKFIANTRVMVFAYP